MAKLNSKVEFISGLDICKHTCQQDPCKAKEECSNTRETCKDSESYLTDQGLFVLRQPTNEEWNAYGIAKIESQGTVKESKTSMNDAMCDLFDKIVVKLENLIDDDDTPITMDNFKDRINVKEKTGMILQGVELNNQGINLKNS